jgi:hypothetical protein
VAASAAAASAAAATSASSSADVFALLTRRHLLCVAAPPSQAAAPVLRWSVALEDLFSLHRCRLPTACELVATTLAMHACISDPFSRVAPLATPPAAQ